MNETRQAEFLGWAQKPLFSQRTGHTPVGRLTVDGFKPIATTDEALRLIDHVFRAVDSVLPWGTKPA